MQTINDQKAEQLERLIAKIENRLQGKFITEEQLQSLLQSLLQPLSDRLNKLENQIECDLKDGSLKYQIKRLLEENPEGLFAKEIAEKTGRKINAVRSVLYFLTCSYAVIAESMYQETGTKEKRYSLRRFSNGM